jgi:hypothetical protein
MNVATWGSAAAIYNGVAYVFGGVDGGNDITVQAYNFATDSWTTKNNLPDNLAGQGEMAVTVGSLIYVFGGWSGTSAYSYNPSTDTYTQLANIPFTTRWGDCAYVNVNGEDRIYIMGGFSYNTYDGVNTMYYYTPANNEWTYAGTTPYAAYGTIKDDPVVNGLIYFGFGQGAGNFYSNLYSYDPNTATWSSALPSGTYPRDGVACGVINGELYVVGGRNSYSEPIPGLNYNEQYNPENPLTATISPTQVRLRLGQSQTFTSTVSGGTPPYSYQWVLNGTAVSGATSSSWTFTPAQVGHYNVYLEVTDSLDNQAQSNTVSNILVYLPLSVSISPTSANIVLGGSQQFNSTVTGGVPPNTYQWVLNGTAVSGATNSTWIFTPAQTGHYNVYLNVTDSLNNKAQSNIVTNILVYSPLSVTISPTSANIVLGGSQQFNSTITGGVSPYSYQWVLNGTAVSGATNSTWIFTPAQTGHFNVYVNVTDSLSNKAQSNIVTNILVYSPLSVTISPTSANIVLGGSQQFNSTVTGGVASYSYQWVLNGTNVSGATNSTWIFTPAQTGHYNVYLNVTDSLSNKAQSNIVNNILVYNQLTVSISPTNVTLYYGQSQTFNSTVTGGITPYTYQWYLNGTAVSGATSPTWAFTPTANGNYNVYLNVTDSLSNKAQSNIITNLNVYSINLLLTAGANQPTYTPGQTVTFTVEVFNRLNPSFKSTLTFTVTGPNGYYFYDSQPINLANNTNCEYTFDWTVPNTPGTYIVETSLAPSLLTAYDATWQNVNTHVGTHRTGTVQAVELSNAASLILLVGYSNQNWPLSETRNNVRIKIARLRLKLFATPAKSKCTTTNTKLTTSGTRLTI